MLRVARLVDSCTENRIFHICRGGAVSLRRCELFAERTCVIVKTARSRPRLSVYHELFPLRVVFDSLGECFNVPLFLLLKRDLTDFETIELPKYRGYEQDERLVELERQLVVPQLGLDERTNDFGEEERQDVDDTVHDLLAQAQQVVEVNGAILFSKRVSDLVEELLGQTKLLVIAEPVGDDDPEEVDDEVVEGGLIVLEELDELVALRWLLLELLIARRMRHALTVAMLLGGRALARYSAMQVVVVLVYLTAFWLRETLNLLHVQCVYGLEDCALHVT